MASTFDADLRRHPLAGPGYWIDALPGIAAGGYVTSIDGPDAVHRPGLARSARPRAAAGRGRGAPPAHPRLHPVAQPEQLAAVDAGTGVFQNFAVSSVGTFVIYFDGVTVLGGYIRPPAGGIAAADAALARALTATTGVAVRFEHGRLVPA